MSESFVIEPIALVRAARVEAEDDFWGGEVSEVVLDDRFDTEALAGLESFSHVEILFLFDRVASDRIVTAARHPRNNPDWPRVGIFAQRGKNRPNRIGCTVCRLLGVDGRVLKVAELDAIDGSPVIDIKPVMRQFLPRESTTQPEWVDELMARYWSPGRGGPSE